MGNKTSLLQQWLESVWYEDGNGRFLLMPFSYLYSAINNYQRKTQTQKQVKLLCPVIVVGNITVGGTGKTPLTIHIVKLFQKAGYKPAIITRGYGGKAKSWPQFVNADSDASLVGDEAVLMAQRTGVPVYAGANRLESVSQLLDAHDCDVIVSDDGMQHYKLPRDIQIAVIDGKRQLGNGYCLPAGPMREKKERLDSCDLIVVNGKTTLANNANKKNYFEMALSGKTLINLSTNEEKQLSDFSEHEIQALTGIGNPQRFYSTLEASGLNISENSFPDHYAFQERDLSFSDDSIVIMTEKDAVKCKSLIGNDKHYWYLPVTANLPHDFDDQLLEEFKTINLP
ncbi:MAG: tetraacyldisaccharide 4'-kinase [Cocleimonas sp.]